MVTQKSQYALRALFELGRRTDAGPTKIEDIAKAQGIPQRFLEVVLNELKHAGLVEAKRGPRGGYLLDPVDYRDVKRIRDEAGANTLNLVRSRLDLLPGQFLGDHGAGGRFDGY